ncbi:hypothetical protein [Cryptosporangium phraense]|uniref:Uncharacterized protein n=1 Tax=Cryptosporangium phraense TaxID=2593070 RepID=A0A545AZW8_9ACTN|nr:hypothetical protein [Cryptosporangium phraense]TQS46871.1 hypothetical protein FL583_00915 [Cryptosporangium phraense]
MTIAAQLAAVAAKPSPATVASAAPAPESGSRARDRLQAASLWVGVVVGLVTIAKELIAAIQLIFR